jgi:(S)-2-hydroxyglutarate dehydrogenase
MRWCKPVARAERPAPVVFDVVVIGGGIVGCATAAALLQAAPDLRVVLLEKEARLAAHQTGHNSGVIHSGLYYRPGSLKASNCCSGREALYGFCAEQGIAHERCGKVVVATGEEELPLLAELERRGRANGLEGIERLDKGALRQHEPQVSGIAGLFVPQTGIVDYVAVTEALAGKVRQAGGEVRLNARVVSIRRQQDVFRLGTPRGTVTGRQLVNCAGLQCDRVAQLAGLQPELRIVPFRGEYYVLKPDRRGLVRNLIYPVPDPAFPFLGVHYTRMIDGEVEAGPNAVLALDREGYGRWDWSLRDVWETFSYSGFWSLAGRYWDKGLREVRRSCSKSLFVRDLQRLIPALREEDLVRGGAGIRAQAVDRDGALVDDFRLLTGEGMVHVLNAPSPAATAALSIGATIATKVLEQMRA